MSVSPSTYHERIQCRLADQREKMLNNSIISYAELLFKGDYPEAAHYDTWTTETLCQGKATYEVALTVFLPSLSPSLRFLHIVGPCGTVEDALKELLDLVKGEYDRREARREELVSVPVVPSFIILPARAPSSPLAAAVGEELAAAIERAANETPPCWEAVFLGF